MPTSILNALFILATILGVYRPVMAVIFPCTMACSSFLWLHLSWNLGLKDGRVDITFHNLPNGFPASRPERTLRPTVQPFIRVAVQPTSHDQRSSTSGFFQYEHLEGHSSARNEFFRDNTSCAARMYVMKILPYKA